MIRATLACLLACGACIAPEYGVEPFFCQTGVCPAGYACVAGRCRRGSLDLTADQAQVPDAPRDASPTDGPAELDGPAPPADQGPLPWTPPGSWVSVKAGKFLMGSPAGEACRESDEQQHEVTFGRGFAMMSTPVTRTMYEQIRGYYPAGVTACADCPAGDVTWHEAAAYCNELSIKAGLARCYFCNGDLAEVSCVVETAYAGKGIYACPGYRLPTEAEWEYGCRAGTTTSLYSGELTHCTGTDPLVDDIAWYVNNAGSTIHPVGQKRANAWGLHDMVGNAWQWCHDRYAADLGSAPVTDPANMGPALGIRRGGSFNSGVGFLRSANRGFEALDTRFVGAGLRCVRSL